MFVLNSWHCFKVQCMPNRTATPQVVEVLPCPTRSMGAGECRRPCGALVLYTISFSFFASPPLLVCSPLILFIFYFAVPYVRLCVVLGFYAHFIFCLRSILPPYISPPKGELVLPITIFATFYALRAFSPGPRAKPHKLRDGDRRMGGRRTTRPPPRSPGTDGPRVRPAKARAPALFCGYT